MSTTFIGRSEADNEEEERKKYESEIERRKREEMKEWKASTEESDGVEVYLNQKRRNEEKHQDHWIQGGEDSLLKLTREFSLGSSL
jgi:hypothetical protein